MQIPNVREYMTGAMQGFEKAAVAIASQVTGALVGVANVGPQQSPHTPLREPLTKTGRAIGLQNVMFDLKNIDCSGRTNLSNALSVARNLLSDADQLVNIDPDRAGEKIRAAMASLNEEGSSFRLAGKQTVETIEEIISDLARLT